jgi:L-malate glycosyltransferase
MLLPETLKLHNKEKFEFHYIYFLPWKNQVVGELERAGGTVVCLSAKNNIGLMLKYREIIRYIKANNIQLVHSHLPWAGFVGRLVKKLTGIPVLYTEHNKQERYHWVTYGLNRLTFNWMDAGIAVSEDVAFSIHEKIGPRIPVKIITNGVNTDYFKHDPEAGKRLRKQYGIDERAVVVGIVAVFRFQKRLKEWLEVFAAVANRNPQVQGVIVGDGPLKEEVEAHMMKLGIEDRITLPGLQTDIRPWYSAMDVFMMSSVFEGMPVALLEAMSMECAVVSTDAGGVKEVIRHQADGLMVSVDQWKELEGHLENLCTNELLRQRLRADARQKVEKQFSLVKMVRELEEVYEKFQTSNLTNLESEIRKPLLIRPATSADLPSILELSGLSLGMLGGMRTPAYWQWKHERNPFGVSPVWVAEEAGKLIGVRAFMPWKFRYKGETFQAYRAVDTATHPDHQGKGIFKNLTLTLVDQLKNQGPSVIFNTPNHKSMPGYLKMDWKVAGKTPLRVKLFPVNLVRHALGWQPPIVTPLSFPDNLEPILHAWMHLHHDKVLTDYSLDFLKWRYAQVPGLTYGLHAVQVNTSSCVMIYRMKKTKGLHELRVVEVFYSGDEARSAVRLALRELATHYKPGVLTLLNDTEEKLTALLPGGFFGADKYGLTLTVRKVNDDRLEALLMDQRKWFWSAGTVELF